MQTAQEAQVETSTYEEGCKQQLLSLPMSATRFPAERTSVRRPPICLAQQQHRPSWGPGDCNQLGPLKGTGFLLGSFSPCGPDMFRVLSKLPIKAGTVPHSLLPSLAPHKGITRSFAVR
jgi:hypothetical protein